jgi:predicted oxidoreductase
MTWVTAVRKQRWSEDNAAEIAKGWVLKADSVAELAARMGRDARRVQDAVERYEAACRERHDPDFGRAAHTLQPLQGPPYYAVKIVPTIVCTSGGARRNIESEVLTPSGTPIPRLYEAGELGSMISHLYQNGSYLTEAMISGRAAGANAVRLPAWRAERAA